MSERSISSGIGTIIMEMDTIIKDKELVESKRKQIVRGAIELFLVKGYSETTVREIANNTNISMGTLYNYINKKEDIVYLGNKI